MKIIGKYINYHLGGTSSSSTDRRIIVFQVHYGNKDFIDNNSSPAKFGIRMQSDLFPVNFVENWYAAHDSNITNGFILNGRIQFVEVGNNILFFGEIGTPEKIEETTCASYAAILDVLQAKGFRSLVRSWNFIPDINGFFSKKIENYQAFCKGRAMAFEEGGINELQMPSATGIGSHSKLIYGYLIASKNAEHSHIENPLQSPAYEYPCHFGPKPPSFARGTVLNKNILGTNAGTHFFLSGTASIRESETMWPGDVQNQVNTTMENIKFLISNENIQLDTFDTPMALSDFEHFKVYFRRLEDYLRIRELLVESWMIDPNKLHFMNVDICRSDLLVEIEGCIRMPNQPSNVDCEL